MAKGMSRISTHVLDIAGGRPAVDIPVRLERRDVTASWRVIADMRTDSDGRCNQLLPENEDMPLGWYRLVFETESYYAAQKTDGLYPVIEIIFQVRNGESHFHIPVLLSPNGYTTYRGS